MTSAGTVEVTARVRVRVTLEADAAKIPGTQLLRISTGEGIAVIDPAASNVTVEEVVPPRTWAKDDVVQSEKSGTVYVRQDVDAWHSSDFATGSPDDDQINRAVATGEFRVLRYQAGEK